MKKYMIALPVALGLAVSASAAAISVIDGPLTTAVSTGLGAIGTNITAGNTILRLIAGETTRMLTIMSTPTPVVAGFKAADGGATAGAVTLTTQYMPALLGEISVLPQARGLVASEELELQADSAKGMVSGNSAGEQLERQRLVNTNIQGMAYGTLQIYGARVAATQAIESGLAVVPDIKAAVTYNGAIEAQSLRTLNLIGQSVSLNTTAIAEARLQAISDQLRVQDDYRKTALLYGAKL